MMVYNLESGGVWFTTAARTGVNGRGGEAERRLCHRSAKTAHTDCAVERPKRAANTNSQHTCDLTGERPSYRKSAKLETALGNAGTNAPSGVRMNANLLHGCHCTRIRHRRSPGILWTTSRSGSASTGVVARLARAGTQRWCIRVAL